MIDSMEIKASLDLTDDNKITFLMITMQGRRNWYLSGQNYS